MKREVKIGLFAVTMICAAWAGIRFLKGFDVFSRSTVYYAAYDQVNGLQAASAIMMRGVKIGTVTDIVFDPVRSDKVAVQLSVRRQYRIPSDSEAKIVNSSLMGNKAIEIVYGSAADFLQPGDTLRSGRDRDLMDVAGSELDFFKQKVAQLTGDISETLEHLNRLLADNEAAVGGTLTHLNSITGDMAGILSDEKRNLRTAVDNLTEFSAMLGANAGRVDSIVGGLNRITVQLSEEEFARKIAESAGLLNDLLNRLNADEGTIGRMLNDPALYDSLTVASGNLAALLADVKEYPGRYVHFSVFGSDPDKVKARAEKKAARAAAKAERDSLRRTVR